VRAFRRRRPTPLALLAALALTAGGCGQSVQAEPDPPPAPAAPEPEPAEEVEIAEAEPLGTAPLTGVGIFDRDELDLVESRPAVVVKIPNDPAARPHTGIERADVVYEQETEGGVTRFAAVFQSDYPDVVGNVRSGRAVDAHLAAPYRGIIVYSGARASVQAQIDAAGLTRVTEGGAGFYRDGSRRAPHNLYSRLPEAAASRDADPAEPSPWRFDAEMPDGGREVTGRVTVAVSRSATAGWDYDEDAGVFRRLQNNTPHTVTGDGSIGAANVVVLDVPVTSRDSHGAPVYSPEGAGDALLLRDGRAFDIRWAKAGRDAHLELVDGTDEATLAPGPTWVVLTYGGAVGRVGGLGRGSPRGGATTP
jgi:hypothetical protein